MQPPAKPASATAIVRARAAVVLEATVAAAAAAHRARVMHVFDEGGAGPSPWGGLDRVVAEGEGGEAWLWGEGG